MPSLYQHCITIYDAMKETAVVTEFEDSELLAYEGFLTKLFIREHMSVPYYTSVMQELQQMDCVRQLRRGGGSSPSLWAMIQRPTRALWDTRSSRPLVRTQRQANNDAAAQHMRDMQRQLDVLFEFTGAPRPS